mmetsp:Transcript_28352/g.46085  ORF Transcript_28352/g.46085 Transcript_28352/m.46085 type:complete len:230 (-) Transcript_28352:187-876(-)
MVQRILRRNPILRTVRQKSLQQIKSMLVRIVQERLTVLTLVPHRIRRIPIRQRRHSRPHLLVGRAQLPENFVDFVNLRIARKQRSLRHHLHEDGPDGPHVHGRSVRLRSQQDLGRAVPQRDDLVRQRSNGRAECPRESEVGEFEDAVAGDEEILRLEIAVHDSPGVAEGESAAHLEEVGFDQHGIEESVVRLERLFQVAVEEFEDEVELAILLDAVFQVDNIFVSQFSQ